MAITVPKSAVFTLAAILHASTGAAETAPRPQAVANVVVAPVVAGNIMDHQPFDGHADDSDPDLPTVVGLTPGEAEFRGVLEFDVGAIGSRRVRKAELRLVPLAKGVPPGQYALPVEIRSYYSANGTLELADFYRGNFVAVFDLRTAALNVPQVVVVTNLVRSALAKPNTRLGFTLRTNATAQLVLGSLELAPAPTLVISVE